MSNNKEIPHWKFFTQESWETLKATGMLWEFFPEATGNFKEDIKNKIIYAKVEA